MSDWLSRGDDFRPRLPACAGRPAGGARAVLLTVLASALCLAPGRPALARDAGEILPSGTPDRVEDLSTSLAAILPGADPQQTAQLARALAEGVPAPNVLRQFSPLLRQAAEGSLSELADRLEVPGNRLDYEISGSKPLVPGISGALNAGSSGGKMGVSLGPGGLSLAGYSVSANPSDRSLGATLAYGPTIRLEPGVEFKRVCSVKFSYGTNRGYLEAIGIASLPGMQSVLQIMDGRFRKARSASGATIEDAARAAFRAVRNTVFPNSEAMDQYDSVTLGSGFEITVRGAHPAWGLRRVSPEGAMTFTHLDMERIKRKGSGGRSTPFFEETVGAELTGRAGMPAAGGVAGTQVAASGLGRLSKLLDRGSISLSLALTHSTDPDEQTPDPALAAVAQRLRDGKIGEVIEAAAGQTAPLWDGERIRRGLRQLAVAAHGRLAGAGRILAVKGPKAGGVMVYYDPALLANAVPPGELAASLQQLVANQQAGKTSFSLRVDGREESFVTLSLKEWLATGTQTLGDLTRVRGYIRKPGDIILIGQAEPDRPAIDADVLTVALASVYRRGTTPFVSLDPDPYDPYGLQKPRVGGVPPTLTQTEFVRVMLDADYDMKRINLGELAVEVPGFRSWFEILRRARQDDAGLRRFWLRPMWMGAGDVLEHGPAVLFASDVQVLTERLKQVGDYVAPDGRLSPADEAAADQLTHHYPELERQLDSFYQLHALFDITKLCAILRYRVVKSPVLDAIARRAVRTVRRADEQSVLAPYAGIGPKVVEGTHLIIGGGAVAKAGLTRSTFAPSAALGDLLRGKTTLTLERSVPLPRAAHPELLVSAAVQDFAENRLPECVRKSTRALAEDPDLATGYVYRALARFGLGQPREALADLNRAVGAEPAIQGFRGVVKLYLGDVSGARRDVDAAARSHPDLEAVWQWNAMVKVYSLDFRGAAAAIDRLFDFHATSIEAYRLRALTQLLRRMTPAEAKRRTRMLLGLPIPLSQAFADGYTALQMSEMPEAVAQLTRALRLSRQLARDPSVRGFHARERALFLLAVAESSGLALGQAPAAHGRTPGIARADEIIALHPRWASGYLLKALCVLKDRSPGRDPDPRSLIDPGFARVRASDPLLQDWALLFGAENLRPYFYAMTLVVGKMPGRDKRLYLVELAKERAAAGGLARALLAFEAAARDLRARRQLWAKADAVLGRKPASDPASLILYSLFLATYRQFAAHVGDPERALRAARTLQTHLPTDHPTYEGLTLIGLFRWLGMTTLCEAYEIKSLRDRELAELAAAAAQGEIDREKISQRAGELTDVVLEESARRDTAFVHALIAPLLETLRFELRRGVLARAKTAVARNETLSSERKAEIAEGLGQAEAELDAAQRAWTREHAEERDAQFDACLAQARTSADLRTLDVMLRFLAPRLMQTEDSAEAARMEGVIALLTAKIHLKTLGRRHRSAG